VLEHVRRAAIDAGEPLAKNVDLPCGRRQQAGNHVQERGFSTAAGTDERNETPRRNVQGDAFDRGIRPESFDDITQRQRRVGECAEHGGIASLRGGKLVRVKPRRVDVCRSDPGVGERDELLDQRRRIRRHPSVK